MSSNGHVYGFSDFERRTALNGVQGSYNVTYRATESCLVCETITHTNVRARVYFTLGNQTRRDIDQHRQTEKHCQVSTRLRLQLPSCVQCLQCSPRQRTRRTVPFLLSSLVCMLPLSSLLLSSLKYSRIANRDFAPLHFYKLTEPCMRRSYDSRAVLALDLERDGGVPRPSQNRRCELSAVRPATMLIVDY